MNFILWLLLDLRCDRRLWLDPVWDSSAYFEEYECVSCPIASSPINFWAHSIFIQGVPIHPQLPSTQLPSTSTSPAVTDSCIPFQYQALDPSLRTCFALLSFSSSQSQWMPSSDWMDQALLEHLLASLSLSCWGVVVTLRIASEQGLLELFEAEAFTPLFSFPLPSRLCRPEQVPLVPLASRSTYPVSSYRSPHQVHL